MTSPKIKTQLETLMEETDSKLKKPSKTRIFFRWLIIFSLAVVLSALFTASYLFYEGFSPKSIELQNPVQEIFRIKSDEVVTTKAPVRAKTTPQIVLNAQPVANDPKAQ